MLDTGVYDRYALPAGFAAPGPAVLEEYGSTTIVWPGDRFAIGTLDEIRIDCTSRRMHDRARDRPSIRSRSR